MSENENKLNTINYIYDDVRKVVNSCVIKYENIAKENETAESMRAFDYYLISVRESDTFDSHQSFPPEVIRNAGVLDNVKIIQYSQNKRLIPKDYRERIVKENRKFIIENYEEKNNYYRMLIGLPDIGDTDYVYLDKEMCDRYSLDPNKPIHKYTREEIASISFQMDSIISKYPDKKYLNFLGANGVDLIRARTARNFEIIKADMSSHVVFLKSFFSTYNMCREYFNSVIYVKEKYARDPLYDNFIAMNIMLMTIQRVLINTFKLGVDRDFYDLYSIKTFFNSYGVPYFETLPLDYQRMIMKRVNILLRAKSTDRCLYDITSLLFLDRVSILEYYLVKEQLYDDNDIPLKILKEVEDEDGEIKQVEDVFNMYDIHFQAIDMKERNLNLALESEASRVDYYETVYDDPFWWDDEDVLKVLTEKDFNYIDTKYIGLNIMYNLTQMMFETVYFINLLVDKKNEIHRPQLHFALTIKLPRITTAEVSIFDAVILLCALTCKKNHFAGNIINSGTKILSVMGFDFEENFKAIREDVVKHKDIYDQTTLEYFEKMNIHSKDDINYLYDKMVGLAEFCKEKMNKTDDVRVFHAYRQLYDAMMVKKYTTNVLTKRNGEVATTYLDYLNDQNAFLADFVNNCTVEQTGIYIDHILGTLNELIPDLEYLSSINGTDNIVVTALVKLIEFFKSYTVELKNINILYVMDDQRYNMIRMVSDPTITVTWYENDLLQHYLDSLGIHVDNLIEDFVKPLDMLRIHSRLLHEEHPEEKFHEEILIKSRMIIEDITKMLYADQLNSMVVNGEFKYKLILEEMQQYLIKFYLDEKNTNREEFEIISKYMMENALNIRYGDVIKFIESDINEIENMNIEDQIKYYSAYIYNEAIKFIFDNDFRITLYEEDAPNIKYTDWVAYIIENKEIIENVNIVDLYKMFLNYEFNEEIKEVDGIFNMVNTDEKSEEINIIYNDNLNLIKVNHTDEIIKFNENIRIYYE